MIDWALLGLEFGVATLGEAIFGGNRVQHERARDAAISNVALIDAQLALDTKIQEQNEAGTQEGIATGAAFSGVLEEGSVVKQQQQAAEVLADNLATLKQSANVAKDPYTETAELEDWEVWLRGFGDAWIDQGIKSATRIGLKALDVLLEAPIVDPDMGLTPQGELDLLQLQDVSDLYPSQGLLTPFDPLTPQQSYDQMIEGALGGPTPKGSQLPELGALDFYTPAPSPYTGMGATSPLPKYTGRRHTVKKNIPKYTGRRTPDRRLR